MRQWIRTLFFVCFFSFSLNAFCQSETRYAVVIDAGSSGSRVHLFRYQTQAVTLTNAHIQEINFYGTQSNKSKIPLTTTDIAQPLATFSTPFSLAMTYVHNIPNFQEQQLDIYIYSTAGMRVIDPLQKETINMAIENELKKEYPQVHRIEVRTIAGQEEALFLWLDVNTLKGNFNNSNQPTQGTIDIGGASAQIAYEVTNTENTNVTYTTINLFGQKHTLYLNSLLHAGQDEARNKINSEFVTTPNPCYLSNSDPKVTNANFSYSQCTISAYAHLHSPTVTSENPQNISLMPMPPVNTSFFGVSGAYYISNFFGAKNNTQISIGMLEENVQKFCTKNWSDFQQSFPKFQDPYLSQRCANGVYIHSLLTQGAFGFPENEALTVASQLTPAGEQSAVDVDWTLGVVVAGLSQSP
jgi:hypothetical protein